MPVFVCYVPAMVRLVYTCPATGVAIIGGGLSEHTFMRYYYATADVKCAGCNTEHHPKVFECRAFRRQRRTLKLVRATQAT